MKGVGEAEKISNFLAVRTENGHPATKSPKEKIRENANQGWVELCFLPQKQAGHIGALGKRLRVSRGQSITERKALFFSSSKKR